MFYDRGEKYDPEHIGLDLLKKDMENDRYVEIWNIVFSQFNSEPGKKREEYKELPSKNIDTGAGLERFACIIQETDTNFETDLFYPIILEVEKLTGHKYEENHLAFRVIADHIRSITFALADGEMFSNEGRGYVLRRLLRRAERYGRVLGINKPFLYNFVNLVADIMRSYYPYLDNKKEFVAKMIKAEEEKFIKTLANGENLLLKAIDGKDTLSSEDMFRLYDTFGFPKELTIEICDEHGVKVDLDGFNKLMEEQKERARKARGDRQSMNKQSIDLMNCTLESEFLYNESEVESEVIACFKDGVKVDSITDSGEVMLRKTCFYAESGGQVSDSGTIENDELALKVVGVNKAPNKQHLHSVEVLYGEVKVGDKVKAKIDSLRRMKIMRNHSSVHLLQKALTEVLGDHIAQHGSYVDDEYSHFDFNHFQKMTPEQLNEVEKKVNEYIAMGIPCETKVLPIQEAQQLGAKALFNDKYGDMVRVVCFGEVSKEFCGGTHVSNTQDIGMFVIEYEESVAAGIRRIQARTSYGAYELIKHRENILNRVRDTLGTSSYEDVNQRLNSLVNEKDELRKDNAQLNDKLAYLNAGSLKDKFFDVNGLSVLLDYQRGQGRNDLMSLIDNLKQNKDNYLIVLFGEENGGVPIVAACSKEAISKGYKAGQIVKLAANKLLGGGGGRDEIASGSGRDASKIEEAISAIKDLVK